MTAVPSELPTDPIVGAPGSPNQFDHFYSPGYISGGSPSHHSHHSKKKPRKGINIKNVIQSKDNI